MAINSTTTATTTGVATASKSANPKGVLGKDDFMKLLLVQMQYQDPTSPMDTEKILTQTSQLATLESSDNTKKALEKLSTSLGNAQQFSTISAIGKTADLGSDAISLDKGKNSTFEIYFPATIDHGTVDIKDSSGEVVKTLDVGTNPAGIYKFTWDGKNRAGDNASGGVYHVSADYTDQAGNAKSTRLGTYPIESVRFDKGEAHLKVGSNYVALNKIKEIY